VGELESLDALSQVIALQVVERAERGKAGTGKAVVRLRQRGVEAPLAPADRERSGIHAQVQVGNRQPRPELDATAADDASLGQRVQSRLIVRSDDRRLLGQNRYKYRCPGKNLTDGIVERVEVDRTAVPRDDVLPPVLHPLIPVENAAAPVEII